MRAFLEYLRDCIVLFIPVRKLPKFLVRLFYGQNIDFVFLVHARFYEDIYISSPFLKPLKLLMRKESAYRMFARMPSFVLNGIRTQQGKYGVVIAQMTVPEIMIRERKLSALAIARSLRLASKICVEGAVVGLGGWIPMITRAGLNLKTYSDQLGLKVTNGHCGTLASIYMMVQKLAEAGGIGLHDVTLAIVGAGKMGANVARAFNERVKRLIIVDINKRNLSELKRALHGSKSVVDTILWHADDLKMAREVFKEANFGIFATSALRNVMKIRDLPPGFIAIDDSRPEALPRDPKNERIVLEGGLLKIKGAEIDYDYGFGFDDNVFGCLGEAFVVSLSSDGQIEPTLGQVDMENFERFVTFCEKNGVETGDFKSSDYYITEEDLKRAFAKRGIYKVHV